MLVTSVSPAETVEPIGIPFGSMTLGGPRNYVLSGGSDTPTERGIVGVWGNTWACTDLSAVDVLNFLLKRAAAMPPLTTNTVSTCCQ